MKSDTLHDESHGEAREGGSRPEHNKGHMQQALVNMTVRRAKLKLWPRSVTRQGCPFSTPVQYRARSLGESNETRWNKKDTNKKNIVNVFLSAEDTTSHTRLQRLHQKLLESGKIHKINSQISSLPTYQ